MSNLIEPQLSKIDDVEYFALGRKDLFNEKALITSASFFKSVFSSDLYQVLLMGDNNISDDLQYIFDVGSAFHCYVLETSEFDKRYYIADFANMQEKRTLIKSLDFVFIKESYKNIKIKYPEILEESEFNEVALKCEIDGVPYKAKVDKLVLNRDGSVEIIDLKSVWFDFYSKKFMRNSDGVLYNLIREMKSLNYDLQGYCYYRGVKELLDYQNLKYTDITFSLLLASKDTFDVKKVSFSAEMMASGKEKFNFVFPQVKSFYDFGISKVEDSEYL